VNDLNSLRFRQLIFRGVKRRTFRNIVTILTFAVVTGSLLSTYFLIGGAQNSTQAGMDRLGADMLVVPGQYAADVDAIILSGRTSTFFFNSSVLSGVNSVAGIAQVAPQTYIATLNFGCCAFPTQLISFNSTNDFTILPWLREDLGRPLVKDEVICGAQIIGADPGLNLMFYGHEFVIAGILDPTGTGVDQSIFIQDSDALQMAKDSGRLAVKPLNLKEGEISAVLIKLSPGANAEQVSAAIESAVPNAHVVTSAYLAREVSNQLSGTIGSLYLMAGAVTLVSVPLVATVSSMVANERKREIGLLRAMGANKRFVFSIVLVEALILAGLGAIIGAVVTAIIIAAFQNLIMVSLGIPFLWPSLLQLTFDIGLVGIAAVVIGGLASLYPAIRASRLDPYDAIRSGQN
jgi:putative ABC transport system permease protein